MVAAVKTATVTRVTTSVLQLQQEFQILTTRIIVNALILVDVKYVYTQICTAVLWSLILAQLMCEHTGCRYNNDNNNNDNNNNSNNRYRRRTSDGCILHVTDVWA